MKLSICILEEGISQKEQDKAVSSAIRRLADALEGGDGVFDMLMLYAGGSGARIGYINIEAD